MGRSCERTLSKKTTGFCAPALTKPETDPLLSGFFTARLARKAICAGRGGDAGESTRLSRLRGAETSLNVADADTTFGMLPILGMVQTSVTL